MITQLGVNIIGFGLLIPSTIVLITNIIIKITSGDKYELHIGKLFKVYLVWLISLTILFGIKL